MYPSGNALIAKQSRETSYKCAVKHWRSDAAIYQGTLRNANMLVSVVMKGAGE
jgi:hypothetical protein